MGDWICRQCSNPNPAAARFCGACGTAAAPPGIEERRLVTALFADLSGFTPLAARLDAEELLAIIDPVIVGLSDIVGRYDGYVEKFAGDALLALFGAPKSHEDDAERALMVALEMHRELAILRQRLGRDAAELTLHVGVNSGHGIARVIDSSARTDYAVLGDAVILAQRLESAAPPGETYVGEETYRLAMRAFEFEPLGELELKGRTTGVRTWRLLRKSADPVRSATQDLTPSGRTGDLRRRIAPAADPRVLAGRRHELAQLTRALDALEAGRGSAVMVSGEPGVGKSRLGASVREDAESRGFRWLRARCVSYGSAFAYGPYADLVRGYAGIDAETTTADARARLDAALGPMLPSAVIEPMAMMLGIAPALPSGQRAETAESTRAALHAGVREWLAALAGEGPTILEIEDMQWADDGSRALTAHLVAAVAAEVPALLYLTARTTIDEDAATADLGDEPIEQLHLGPLDEEASRELTASILGGPVSASLSTAIATRCAGNPFFIEELVAALRDGMSLAMRPDGWALASATALEQLPTTVEGVLSARIDALSSRATEILRPSCVIGRQVPLALLAAVEKRPPADLDAALDDLIRAGMFERQATDGESVDFRHALIQDTAYARLLKRQRRELHGRVGAASEALYGNGDDNVEVLARHYYLAEAGTAAIPLLLRAGARARQLYANDEATVHFERAVELLEGESGDAVQLADARIQLAELADLRGDYATALGLFDRVAEGGDVRVAAGRAAMLRKLGRYAEALDTTAGVLASPPADPEQQRLLWLERGWTLSVQGRTDEALHALREGLSRAPDARDRIAGQLRLQLSRVQTIRQRADEAVGEALAARQVFRELNDIRWLATTMRILGDAHRAAGDLEAATSALQEGISLASRAGVVEEVAGCLMNLGVVALQRADYRTAIDAYQRAVREFERIGNASGRATGYVNLSDALFRAGDADQAASTAAVAVELASGLGMEALRGDALDTLALVAVRSADWETAAGHATEAARAYRAADETERATECLGVAADALERAGRPAEALAARAEAAELGRTISAAVR